ncbi:hypothetical protein CTheo_4275 [Ceratobasidium theobromae]|uniref:Uncharacterized protein n=1 Tax=Ceratobasidium theobromae TaxID=1582974 RepID=A0A5N5QL71_9AGAM|nr:hypothetical protein CTheo_4275 [Ceratobasidium theobromae]
MVHGVTMIHATTAAHRQGLVVTGARLVPVHSQPGPPSARFVVTRHRALASFLSLSCVGLAWQAVPSAPLPYALRAVAAVPSPKSAGTSRYGVSGTSEGQVYGFRGMGTLCFGLEVG